VSRLSREEIDERYDELRGMTALEGVPALRPRFRAGAQTSGAGAAAIPKSSVTQASNTDRVSAGSSKSTGL